MSKRGQYFTIDAFIALVVISTGLLLVLAVNSYSPSAAQPEILAYGIVNSFVQHKVNDLNNPFLKEKITDGNITNPHNTILQQAYEFKEGSTSFHADPGLARDMLDNLAPDLVPSQYGFEVRIGEGDCDMILPSHSPPVEVRNCPSSTHPPHGLFTYTRPTSLGKWQNDTDLLISGKRIMFGTNKDREFWGPVLVEVRVWQ